MQNCLGITTKLSRLIPKQFCNLSKKWTKLFIQITHILLQLEHLQTCFRKFKTWWNSNACPFSWKLYQRKDFVPSLCAEFQFDSSSYFQSFINFIRFRNFINSIPRSKFREFNSSFKISWIQFVSFIHTHKLIRKLFTNMISGNFRQF